MFSKNKDQKGNLASGDKEPQNKKENLHSPELAKAKPKKSTQQFLDIMGVRDNTVVLRDGTLRAILMVSSLNFSLKSVEEQNSVIYGYQNFLNSLDFPVQFVIQSRELNIESYLKSLEELEKKQTNELLRIQTIEYREYVSNLVEWGKIMRKRFYVVIPYAFTEARELGVMARIRNLLRPAEVISQNEKQFQKYNSLLDQRVARAEGLLNAMGLKSVRLNTQELIELFYNIYNPATSKNQPMTDIKQLNVV
ncbi:MAG: hypothetical protein WC650_05090 [Candidatus Doudnabacteria bacterium]